VLGRAMSWELEHVDTSNYRPRHQTSSMFRMEEAQPFDARMISMRFGAQPPAPRQQPRARVNPMAFSAPYDEEDETASLVGAMRGRRSDSNVPLLAVCALGTAILALVVFMGTMYWQFTAGVTEARDLSRPYIMDAVNHTLALLHNLDHSSADAHHIVDDVHDLTGSAVPALQHALNQSAMIVDRLERLARNPVLQLSLQNTG
jgi:hypothetical protein